MQEIEEKPENPDTSGSVPEEDDPLVLAELKNKIPLTRQEVMALASQLIRITHQRAVRARFKASSKDATRLSFARACSGLIETYGKLLKEHDIDEIEKRNAEMDKRLQALERVRLRE